MKSIDEAIKERRHQIQRLQEELKVLEHARALLGGEAVSQSRLFEAEAHNLFLGEKLTTRDRTKRKGVHPKKGKISPKSAVGRAIAVLNEKGVQAHLNDILDGVNKRGPHVKKTSLGSTLAKMAKTGRVFFRADAANTFGLLEWRATKTAS